MTALRFPLLVTLACAVSACEPAAVETNPPTPSQAVASGKRETSAGQPQKLARDHIDLQAGYRVRLPEGCTLTGDEQPLVIGETSLPAQHFGCDHGDGRLELWIVETAMADAVDDAILFSFFDPVRSSWQDQANPSFLPHDPYGIYFDEVPRRTASLRLRLPQPSVGRARTEGCVLTQGQQGSCGLGAFSAPPAPPRDKVQSHRAGTRCPRR